MNGTRMHTAATNSKTRIWRSGPATPRPTILFFHIHAPHNFPGPDSITRSEQARQKRLERKATKHERRQWQQKTHPALSFLSCWLPSSWEKHSGCGLRVVTALSGVAHKLGLIQTFNLGLMKQVRAMLHNKITRAPSHFSQAGAG